ncbi:MAG: VOC family protein [Solirubrobacteraceae bacterium]
MPERSSHPPATISWTDLETTDQDGAKAFYGGLFGWEYEDMPVGEHGTYSMAKLNGRSAAAMSGQRPEDTERGVPPHWNVYVTVEDVVATAGRIAGAGGQVLAEPFDVFDAGRMTVAADPSGAILCFWQPGTNIGAEVVNEPGALTWADTATTDAPAAQAFYSALLGWRFDQMSEQPPYWVILNGERSQGGMTVPPPGVPSNWFPYFAVDDVEATAQIAQETGGTPFLGPIDLPNGGRFTLIQDPQRAPFGINQGEMDD